MVYLLHVSVSSADFNIQLLKTLYFYQFVIK